MNIFQLLAKLFSTQPSEYYGGALDIPDPRDYQAEHIFGSVSGELPSRVNLLRTEAKQQGATNHCTAYALTHIHEILNAIEHSMQLQFDPNEQWQNQKKYPGTAREEIGDSLQSALKSLRKFGLTYTGNNYPIQQYAQITSSEIKFYLAKKFPIYTGLPTTQTNFETARTTGYWAGIDGAQTGGHAICFVGYDDEGIVALNSWGKTWGKFGNGTFYVRESDLQHCHSLYIIYDQADAHSPAPPPDPTNPSNPPSTNPPPMQYIYKDVTTNSPMAEAIQWGLSKNIARGYGDDPDPKKREFRPKKPVSRAEMLQMLYNFAKSTGQM